MSVRAEHSIADKEASTFVSQRLEMSVLRRTNVIKLRIPWSHQLSSVAAKLSYKEFVQNKQTPLWYSWRHDTVIFFD